ncbi:MAG: sugar transferase [Myxococcales bacterium]|nr:sugar transferase [Myxococcales bacterium]
MRLGVRLIKRVFDIACSATGLAITVPFYPLIAGAIYLESPGPVFYKQRRVRRLLGGGAGGKDLEFEDFEILKFRTMVLDAEKNGAQLAAKADRRVTRVGRFLRKTRIDELPQLWNVWKGDMSMVGPRPERPEILQQLALAIPYFEERTRGVKPGLTGLAQVCLGYTGEADPKSEIGAYLKDLTNPFGIPEAEGALADDMRVKLLYDLAYCASLEDLKSFARTELEILLKTPLVMLRGSGQ